MKYTGTVKAGVVVLPPDVQLAEGQQVEILIAPSSGEEEFLLHDSAKGLPTVSGLPEDMAINHDYYLHGLRKQQPRQGRWIPASRPLRELSEQEAFDFTEKLIGLAAETSNLPADG